MSEFPNHRASCTGAFRGDLVCRQCCAELGEWPSEVARYRYGTLLLCDTCAEAVRRHGREKVSEHWEVRAHVATCDFTESWPTRAWARRQARVFRRDGHEVRVVHVTRYRRSK